MWSRKSFWDVISQESRFSYNEEKTWRLVLDIVFRMALYFCFQDFMIWWLALVNIMVRIETSIHRLLTLKQTTKKLYVKLHKEKRLIIQTCFNYIFVLYYSIETWNLTPKGPLGPDISSSCSSLDTIAIFLFRFFAFVQILPHSSWFHSCFFRLFFGLTHFFL